VVFYHNILVSVDARLPSLLVEEALGRGLLPQLSGYTSISREVRFEGKRLDFLLDNIVKCYLEVKSVTLVQDGVALFPDAPTQRGKEHIKALHRAIVEGHKGAIIFVAQRADPYVFTSNDSVDPEFGKQLRKAADAGLEVYALVCRVTLEGIEVDHQIPVIL
jgi:sugar fermentation stimulation protein A